MKNSKVFASIVALLALNACATTSPNNDLAKTVYKHRLNAYIQSCQQQVFNCTVIAALTNNDPAVCEASLPVCANKALTEYHTALEAIGEKDASVPLSVSTVQRPAPKAVESDPI